MLRICHVFGRTDGVRRARRAHRHAAGRLVRWQPNIENGPFARLLNCRDFYTRVVRARRTGRAALRAARVTCAGEHAPVEGGQFGEHVRACVVGESSAVNRFPLHFLSVQSFFLDKGRIFLFLHVRVYELLVIVTGQVSCGLLVLRGVECAATTQLVFREGTCVVDGYMLERWWRGEEVFVVLRRQYPVVSMVISYLL